MIYKSRAEELHVDPSAVVNEKPGSCRSKLGSRDYNPRAKLCKTRVVLDNLSFRYSSEDILHIMKNSSFEICISTNIKIGCK